MNTARGMMSIQNSAADGTVNLFVVTKSSKQKQQSSGKKLKKLDKSADNTNTLHGLIMKEKKQSALLLNRI